MAYNTRGNPSKKVLSSTEVNQLDSRGQHKAASGQKSNPSYTERALVVIAKECKHASATNVDAVMNGALKLAEWGGWPVGPQLSSCIQKALSTLARRRHIIYDPATGEIWPSTSSMARFKKFRKERRGLHDVNPNQLSAAQCALIKRAFYGEKLTGFTVAERDSYIDKAERKSAPRRIARRKAAEARDQSSMDVDQDDQGLSSDASRAATEPLEEHRATALPQSSFVSPVRPTFSQPQLAYPTPDSADRRVRATARAHSYAGDDRGRFPARAPTFHSPPATPTPARRTASESLGRLPLSFVNLNGGGDGGDGGDEDGEHDSDSENVPPKPLNPAYYEGQIGRMERELEESAKSTGVLVAEVDRLTVRVTNLETSVVQLTGKNAELDATVVRLNEENTALTEEVAEQRGLVQKMNAVAGQFWGMWSAVAGSGGAGETSVGAAT